MTNFLTQSYIIPHDFNIVILAIEMGENFMDFLAQIFFIHKYVFLITAIKRTFRGSCHEQHGIASSWFIFRWQRFQIYFLFQQAD